MKGEEELGRVREVGIGVLDEGKLGSLLAAVGTVRIMRQDELRKVCEGLWVQRRRDGFMLYVQEDKDGFTKGKI